jgi:hypothetical protein
MGDNTSKNCYCKNNLELTFARRRWGSNTRKCRRAQSIKKEWEASDVGEKEREQNVDWEERKKERRKGTCVGVCVFVFLSFAFLRSERPLPPNPAPVVVRGARIRRFFPQRGRRPGQGGNRCLGG